jgi:hypothetical protein
MSEPSCETTDIKSTYLLRHRLHHEHGPNSGNPHYYIIDWSNGTAQVIMRAPISTTAYEFSANLTDETGKQIDFTPPTATL